MMARVAALALCSAHSISTHSILGLAPLVSLLLTLPPHYSSSPRPALSGPHWSSITPALLPPRRNSTTLDKAFSIHLPSVAAAISFSKRPRLAQIGRAHV